MFLRKVVPGRSDRSYGIQVARLAGLPPSVVARAREILNGLERDELSRGGRPSLNAASLNALGSDASRQLGLFQAPAAGRGSAARANQGDRRRQPDAAPGAVAHRRAQARGRRVKRPATRRSDMRPARAVASNAVLCAALVMLTPLTVVGLRGRALRSPASLSDHLHAAVRHPLSPGRRGAGPAPGRARRDSRRRARCDARPAVGTRAGHPRGSERSLEWVGDAASLQHDRDRRRGAGRRQPDWEHRRLAPHGVRARVHAHRPPWPGPGMDRRAAPRVRAHAAALPEPVSPDLADRRHGGVRGERADGSGTRARSAIFGRLRMWPRTRHDSSRSIAPAAASSTGPRGTRPTPTAATFMSSWPRATVKRR